jgi:hypothetical protein
MLRRVVTRAKTSRLLSRPMGDGLWSYAGAPGRSCSCCARPHGGWRFHDEDELLPSAGASQRSVWISLVDDNVDPNTGVEVTFGPAPAGATHARFRDGDEWFFARVRDEASWLVRWNVPDPDHDEDDDDGLQLVDFSPE